jgi:hypothetical protein
MAEGGRQIAPRCCKMRIWLRLGLRAFSIALPRTKVAKAQTGLN